MVIKMNHEMKQRIEQIKAGQVPEGYKRTKVGIVPEEWEETRFGKMFSRVCRKNTENNDNVLTISARHGLISQSEFFNKSIASQDKSNYFLLYKGEYAYNKSYSNGYPYGALKRLNGYDKGVVSPLYICFSCTDDNECPEYYSHYFESSLMHREIKAVAKEGARNHGLLNISVDDFFNSYLLEPPLAEQEKIAEILSTQDKLIELQQKKIEELQKLKKIYLSKMFPKKGENVPEWRFNGFADAWEQRKFSELYAKSSEKNDGSVGVEKNITVATMQFKDDVRVSTVDYLKTYYTFNIGDIAFEGHQSKEFRYGRFVENDIGNGIVSHIFAVFRPISEYDLHFWKYAINNEHLMQAILSRSTKASTMMHDLVTDDFLNESFLVPTVEEQRKIGQFLDKIDRLITLHRRKFEEMKKQKKSLMQLLLTGAVRA